MTDRKRHLMVTVSLNDGVAGANGISHISFHSTQSMKMQLEVEDPPEKVMAVAANAAEEVARRILNISEKESDVRRGR